MSTYTAVQTTSVYGLADPSIQVHHRPGLSALLIVVADFLGLSLILWGFSGNAFIGQYSMRGGWLPLWPLLPLFLVLYWFFDSYPGVSINPVTEIRQISLANASAFSCISIVLALHHSGLAQQLICVSAFLCATVGILVLRTMSRQIWSRFEWWGYPVVLFGGGVVALSLLRKLASKPHLGLRPVAVIDDRSTAEELEGLPVLESEYLDQMKSFGIRHAIVAAPELSRPEFAEVIERGSNAFPHLILIPDTIFIWKTGIHARDLMGIPGIQFRNNLLDNRSRITKRIIDLTCSTLLTLFLFPIMAIISILIVLESGFPVFYFQSRLGFDGRTFHMWKFRTMMQNSAAVLDHHLAGSSELRKEWAEYQKLRVDPRVTRVGRALRKTSLDELPQLWNIIKGEMSLVGPRPYLFDQLPQYEAAYSVYVKALPGLTGLWQVSGRNRTTLAERIAYDIYYIRNWSLWMDIYLLAKTVGTVFSGDGAY